eukprot:1536443-Pyramimonas_sp.AAC.1
MDTVKDRLNQLLEVEPAAANILAPLVPVFKRRGKDLKNLQQREQQKVQSTEAVFRNTKKDKARRAEADAEKCEGNPKKARKMEKKRKRED